MILAMACETQVAVPRGSRLRTLLLLATLQWLVMVHNVAASDKAIREQLAESNGIDLRREACDQIDCSELPVSRRRICASNGQFYESVCEMQRASCQAASIDTARHHKSFSQEQKLFGRADEFCLSKAQLPQTRVRFVKLAEKCNLHQYEAMKLRLLKEHNFDLEEMFSYFDSNQDRQIEAHELWPRRRPRLSRTGRNETDEQQRDLLVYYAQVWQDHSTQCAEVASDGNDSSNKPSEHDKCWYQLDFAFEPYFMTNPCSLSHLMLFELDHPNESFSHDSFVAVFASLVNEKSKSEETTSKSSLIQLKLSQSTALSCLDGLNTTQIDVDSCFWSRYNVNLALMQHEPHLSLELYDESSDGRKLRDLKLVLRDAQLYLSGRFTCQCGKDQSKRSIGYERTYLVHVLAEPKISVEPSFLWSLPGSRVAFNCRYDYIDTDPLDAVEPGLHSILANPVRKLQDRCLLAEGFGQFNLKLSWEREPSKVTGCSTSNELEVDVPIPKDGRYSSSLISSKLTLDKAQLDDSGWHSCRVQVPNLSDGLEFGAEGQAQLLVRPAPMDGSESLQRKPKQRDLWMFHDNGISIYRLQADDSQEMELLREINGHSLLSSQVEGNWNQLTLCGGLNPEQVVICEWSDNAIHLNVEIAANPRENSDEKHDSASELAKRHYVYVGQPNLNRIVVLDAVKFEIVAIINTEPQPRKLFLFEPNRVRLSKWIRRRIHSQQTHSDTAGRSQISASDAPQTDSEHNSASTSDPSDAQSEPKLMQFDIWLLCYGEPLELDQEPNTSGLQRQNSSSLRHPVQPFTPRLSSPQMRLIRAANSKFASWPNWPQVNKESRLRNRKSVHILQSTFFERRAASLKGGNKQRERRRRRSSSDTASASHSALAIADFKRSTLITMHHVYRGLMQPANEPMGDLQLSSSRAQSIDLIQDLLVPKRPLGLKAEKRYKQHYAYVSHYDERRLFRVSMDELRYNREIDLENCDPISLSQAAQGLLILQCRSPISHSLIGQLVLDELTSARIEFNANIRAQEAFISPDNRYIVNIFTNTTLIREQHSGHSQTTSSSKNLDEQQRSSHQAQSIVYVQLISVSGLKFQYKIKTSLEISQCAFVWRDGYYAAIFVSTNRPEQQSELLSLRLADGRLELMARVPGVIIQSRRKDQLVVSPETHLAVLSTNQGTFVVDLEDNRISQSVRHPQSPPTLLWV